MLANFTETLSGHRYKCFNSESKISIWWSFMFFTRSVCIISESMLSRELVGCLTWDWHCQYCCRVIIKNECVNLNYYDEVLNIYFLNLNLINNGWVVRLGCQRCGTIAEFPQSLPILFLLTLSNWSSNCHTCRMREWFILLTLLR